MVFKLAQVFYVARWPSLCRKQYC